MKQKYEMINSLIHKNEHFYKKKFISKSKYIRNNIILAEKLDNLLIDMNQKNIVKEFLNDQISIIKFNLAIASLSIIDN